MKSTRILIIDDDQVILETLTIILAEEGFIVNSALSAKIGLEILEHTHPDLIILDRNMPEMNGNEMLKTLKLKPETQNVPVIMLTGNQNMNDISQSLELGAKDYIVKPFDPNNLLLRIKKALS